MSERTRAALAVRKYALRKPRGCALSAAVTLRLGFRYPTS